MTKLRYSVPYNNNPDTITELVKSLETSTCKNKIDEIYFSDASIYGSGRIRYINHPTTETIKLIHHNDIRANLIMNSTCDGIGAYGQKTIEQLVRSIGKLHKAVHIDSITIANPLLIQVIKNRIPDIHVTVSVLGEIDSVQRAMFYDKLGADMIVPDRDINRDLIKLKEIKEAIDADIRLMVNEGCIYRCPYRLFHFNHISHLSRVISKKKEATDHFFNNCHQIDRIDPSQVFKSNWIRPEDTRKYRKITSSFKIAGRTREKEWIINTTKAYLEESYTGNFLDLTDSNLYTFKKRFNAYINNSDLHDFHNHVTSCDKNCHRCDYCRNQSQAILKFNKPKILTLNR